MERKIKVAQIGIGNWGKKILDEFCKQADVVAVCHSNSEETSDWLLTNHPSIPSLKYDEILRNNEIEAIVIATPTDTHHKFAMEAIEAGKHVFLEKPGCSSYRELLELAERASAKAVQVAVGYEFVHHPALRKIVEEIEPQQVYALYFTWRKWGSFKDDPIPHLASHVISIAKTLGFQKFEVKAVFCSGLISKSDIVRCELQLNRDVPFFITIDRTVADEKLRELKVILKKGSLSWQNDKLFELSLNSQKSEPIDLPQETAVAAEVKDFILAIKENRTPVVDIVFGLEVWLVIESLQRHL
jgi:predicted dehydrogenase